MEDNDTVTLYFFKSDNDNPIYLDIEIDIEHNYSRTNKRLYLKYSNESEGNLVYQHTNAPSQQRIRVPMYKGWYIQKHPTIGKIEWYT
ncbi:DUF685 domain-containing protein (plasmid) [Borreliella finlandensis]|uniref:DUF685 domain-containing protein n=1 Tax=Borreliella finlandensis TaxID=498741 RepID=UPI003AEF6CC3